jgi:hypothetical protein
MTNDGSARRAPIAGVGGALLIGSLFLPWVDVGGGELSGWELFSVGDVFFLLAGLIAIVAPIAGGRTGLFRPDVSFIGATDMLGVAASAMIAWFLFFDFPDGAGRDLGAWVGLAGAVVQMMAAGDYSLLRGAPAFPRTAKPEAE